jgi:hypothetical protein
MCKQETLYTILILLGTSRSLELEKRGTEAVGKSGWQLSKFQFW